MILLMQNENDLAAMPSMNLFAAVVVLCRIDLNAFLEATPQERVNWFSELIGHERVVCSLRVYIEV